MKVFVLGGSGFVGGHLVRRLCAAGHHVTVGTRYAPSARHLSVVPRVTIRQCNPYDMDSMTPILEGHRAVINLVGILNERGFGGKGFHRAHVELVEKLIISCEAARVERLIQMSAINAGRGDSHYLRTRGAAERLVNEAGGDGLLHTTILRPSVIFGPDDSFLNRFATLLKFSPVLPLARPRARLAPVYVGDVVEAVERLLSLEADSGRVCEVAGAEVWSLKELVLWLRDQLGHKCVVIGLPDAFGWLQALMLNLVPGKPFSTDNFKSLKLDSVCTDNGLVELGIEPWGVSQLAPTWLGSAGRQQRYQSFRRRARRAQRESD